MLFWSIKGQNNEKGVLGLLDYISVASSRAFDITTTTILYNPTWTFFSVIAPNDGNKAI